MGDVDATTKFDDNNVAAGGYSSAIDVDGIGEGDVGTYLARG